MKSHFVIQADRKLEPDQPYYSIKGLKDRFNNNLDPVQPTAPSIEARLLEWEIPNNEFNQAWVSKCFSHFKILKEGEECKIAPVKLMEGLPTPEPIIEKAPEEKPLRRPQSKSKKLKANIEAQLNEIGVEYPKNSSLNALQDILNKELSKSL